MNPDDIPTQTALAERIATDAHHGQVDKLGADYIGHPRRVASVFDPAMQAVEYCAAMLHDVVEDSGLTADDLLAAGVAPYVVDVVVLLTRRDDVSDDTYYARIAGSPAACAVKLADIGDNTAPWRVEQLPIELRERLAAKYAHARELLEEKL